MFPEDSKGFVIMVEKDEEGTFPRKGSHDPLKGIFLAKTFGKLCESCGEKGAKAVEITYAPLNKVVGFRKYGVSGELQGVMSFALWRRSVGETRKDAPEAVFLWRDSSKSTKDCSLGVISREDEVRITASELKDAHELRLFFPEAWVMEDHLDDPIPAYLPERDNFPSHKVFVEELLPWGFRRVAFLWGREKRNCTALRVGAYKKSERF